MIAAERDLIGCEDHPVADDAPQLRRAERAPVRHLRARARDGDGLARRHVRRAADDRRRLGLTDGDRADPQAIGVGVLDHLEHPPDDVVLARRRAMAKRPLDLQTVQCERGRELIGPELGVAVLAQPFDADKHQRSSADS